jgi:MscS family membrane protein
MKITNQSAPVAEAQISVPVGVAYGSSVNKVDEALLSASLRCEYVLPEPPPSVRLVSFGDSAIQFQVLVWISQPEFRAKATDQINRAICEEFERQGIEMPFQQREVHIHTDRQGKA